MKLFTLSGTNDKNYLDLYRGFYKHYKDTGDKEVRHMFAYTLGRLKETAVAGASQKALEAAAAEGWSLRRSKPWNNPYPGVLLCEHHLPKKQVLDKLLDPKVMPQWDDKTALAILAECQCFWITKEENDLLKAKKWTIKRLPDAYEQLSIDIAGW
jgi:hypothetical protein